MFHDYLNNFCFTYLDLMSKLELVEKIHSETIGNKGLQIEKYNKELKEIKLSISNLNEKIEKSSKIMDKTFSFQDPSISRKDFEEFERKISDNILINFEKTYDVFIIFIFIIII